MAVQDRPDLNGSENMIDNILKALLAELGDEPFDPSDLHEIILHLQQRFGVFAEVKFDPSSAFRYSDELVDAIFRLELSGIIGNPYRVTNKEAVQAVTVDIPEEVRREFVRAVRG